MQKPHDHESCSLCGRFNNRGIAIDAVIINNTKVLLIKRGKEPFKGFWALPGGYVEWNESIEESLTKEVKEETNLKVTQATQFKVYSSPERHPRQTITVAFLVKAIGTPEAGDDAEDIKWFDVNTLPELASDHKIIISDALASR